MFWLLLVLARMLDREAMKCSISRPFMPGGEDLFRCGSKLKEPSSTRFDVAIFECCGISVPIFHGFIVLVLVLSDRGTRTRCGVFEYEYEYEYHFIEYEGKRSQNSATTKIACAAVGNTRRPINRIERSSSIASVRRASSTPL